MLLMYLYCRRQLPANGSSLTDGGHSRCDIIWILSEGSKSMQPHRSHQRWDVWVMLPTAVASLWIVGAAHAAPAVTITPEIKSPGNTISPDFCGLSFETKMLLPNGGQYFFRADNTELISLFKSLGVSSLRIGGNSADVPTVDIPTEPDLDQLLRLRPGCWRAPYLQSAAEGPNRSGRCDQARQISDGSPQAADQQLHDRQ